MWPCLPEWRRQQHLVSLVPPLRSAKIGEDCSARTIMWTSTTSVRHPPLCPPESMCLCVCVSEGPPSSQSVLYGISHHRSLSLLCSLSLSLTVLASLIMAEPTACPHMPFPFPFPGLLAPPPPFLHTSLPLLVRSLKILLGPASDRLRLEICL